VERRERGRGRNQRLDAKEGDSIKNSPLEKGYCRQFILSKGSIARVAGGEEKKKKRPQGGGGRGQEVKGDIEKTTIS